MDADRKLTVECRIEGGCLGPQGADFVDDFCYFARVELAVFDAELIHWDVVPRNDKTQTELQYKIAGKNLSHSQASQYLEALNRNIVDFEAQLDDRIIQLIELYMD